ncbi:MAG: FliM/FliN family flagellar motor switch protein [Phycisphaerales bacterium]|nr:MAG: FliM/FliN family flagellar motor switch protein [Phycisphaerales bacterium]
MPETAEAPVASGPQQAPADDKKQAHAVELPEAPENATAGAGSQFDILLDMDVPVKVVLGATEIPVRKLLQLGPGAVLKLEKSIDAPAELFLKDSKFAEAEVVVVDNRFAVRIARITGTDAAGQAES